VPIVEVEDTIRAACRRWQVREVACDPFRGHGRIRCSRPRDSRWSSSRSHPRG
jgi:hypothetical protein